jgi:hypothetical protein
VFRQEEWSCSSTLFADAKNQKKKKAKKLFTTSTLEISNPTIL